MLIVVLFWNKKPGTKGGAGGLKKEKEKKKKCRCKTHVAAPINPCIRSIQGFPYLYERKAAPSSNK